MPRAKFSSRAAEVRRAQTDGGLSRIAKATGLSLMTVSRAINGRPGVSAATRSRVLVAASKLKYRPNALGRALRSGRSDTVGVIARPTTYFNSQVIIGIHDRLAEAGVVPILHFCPGGGETADAELAIIHRLVDLRVDGLIFWPAPMTGSADHVSDAYFREVWERGLPLVAVNRHMPNTHADFSGTDDLTGGHLAADHLLALGHRRIAHLGGPTIVTYADRRRGFEQALAGRSDVEFTFVQTTVDEAHDAALALLRRPAASRPTAIFAASDYFATGVYDAAATLGLRIGTDVSVVGFADVDLAAVLRPRLTTIRQDAVTIGRNAADLLLARRDDPAADPTPRSIRVVPTPVVRESTGRPVT
jgi:LacI family transcriptional regulator